MKKLHLALAVLFAGLLSTSAVQQSANFEIAKNMDVFTTLYKELHVHYVDEIRPGELMKAGIDAMLKTLDPYTVFIPEAEVEDYKFITTGQYGGIGALIHKRGDFVEISEPYEDKPAHLGGLIAGDRILEVNGKSVAGWTTGDVSALLKGQPGTPVALIIERDNLQMEKTLQRENVKIDNIPYYATLDNGIGYIKLSGFTQNAGQDVKKAFLELKEGSEMQGLILDLRGNGGGLLNEAVNVVNIFVDQGQQVVSTKGKGPGKNKTYRTIVAPVDQEIPLIVLVDTASASASEIVAGAIQDLDRGIVIGKRTFGKGLVQNVIPLSYNAQMKITVAKYYIPSGRCIQAVDYEKRDINGLTGKTPDSLSSAFKTLKGRTVYDKGGIGPDILIEPENLTEISMTLITNYLIFDYATLFARNNPSIAPPEEFEISEDMYNDFLQFLSGKDYEYITFSEMALHEAMLATKEEGYFEHLRLTFEDLGKQIETLKSKDLETHKKQIKDILRMELIARYYFQKGKIIASLESDPEINKAKSLFADTNAYHAIISGAIAAEESKKSEKQP